MINEIMRLAGDSKQKAAYIFAKINWGKKLKLAHYLPVEDAT